MTSEAVTDSLFAAAENALWKLNELRRNAVCVFVNGPDELRAVAELFGEVHEFRVIFALPGGLPTGAPKCYSLCVVADAADFPGKPSVIVSERGNPGPTYTMIGTGVFVSKRRDEWSR